MPACAVPGSVAVDTVCDIDVSGPFRLDVEAAAGAASCDDAAATRVVQVAASNALYRV
jgi:hypothetical protein